MKITRQDDMRTFSILQKLFNNEKLSLGDKLYISRLKERFYNISLLSLTADNFSLYCEVLGKYVLIDRLINIFGEEMLFNYENH